MLQIYVEASKIFSAKKFQIYAGIRSKDICKLNDTTDFYAEIH